MYEICENKKTSFHTFELSSTCDYYTSQQISDRLYDLARLKQGLTHRKSFGVVSHFPRRGVHMRLIPRKNEPRVSIYLSVNPRKLVGDFTHIGLMRLDRHSIKKLSNYVEKICSELGLPDPAFWSISRLDLSSQFQSHFGKLLVKLLRNHPLPTRFKILQTRQYNKMRSFFAQSLPENVQLYDKGFKMERDNCTLYTSEDWANAENLWRFELQLHRSKIRQFEHKFKISRTGSLTDRLSAWSSRATDILSMECTALFGHGYYRTMEQAWDLFGMRHEKVIGDYFQWIASFNSVPDAWKHMKALGRTSYLTKLFREADTTPVVLPDSLIAQRERCHFPIPSLSVLFTGFEPKTV